MPPDHLYEFALLNGSRHLSSHWQSYQLDVNRKRALYKIKNGLITCLLLSEKLFFLLNWEKISTNYRELIYLINNNNVGLLLSNLN